MSAVRGPSRLFLIHSGVYGFAELELNEPLHLVAANNVGKTTLIAALQFLYIDNSNQMHFAHQWAQTKRYYFPANNSFILFECMTELGWRVVGVRGLGATRAYDFERFVYQGRFRREDYFEGRRHRSWEEVRDRIIGRSYQRLEPKDLRSSLIGGSEAAPLGLVPLQSAGKYESFRVIFRNLLRLSQLPARQLQDLLIDVYSYQLNQQRIDLQSSHEGYQRVRRRADEIEDLQRVEEHIHRLLKARRERDKLRGELRYLWDRLVQDYRRACDGLRQDCQQVGEQLEELKVGIAAAEREERQIRGKLSDKERALGGVEAKLREFDELRVRFVDFDVERVSIKIDEVRGELRELSGRLHGLRDMDQAEVRRKLKENKERLIKTRRVLEGLKDLVITKLRQDQRLCDEQLEDISRLLHPQLFRLSLDPEQEQSVKVEDMDGAIEQLLMLARRFEGGLYRDGRVSIARSALGECSDLSVEFDPAELEARIGDYQRELERWEQYARDLEERERLELERGRYEEVLQKLQGELHAWESWRREEERRPGLEDKVRGLEAELKRGKEELQQTLEQMSAFRQGQTELEREYNRLKGRLDSLKQSYEQLPRLQYEGEPIAPQELELLDQSLEALFERYRRKNQEERPLTRRVVELLNDIDRSTGSRFSGANEGETVDNLERELESLEGKREAVQQLWSSLIADLRRQLRGLLDDLGELRRQVSWLNAAIGRRQISNLGGFELLIRGNEGLVTRIEAILATEDQPLFADTGRAERATRELAKLLEEHPELDLRQLFDLQLRIEDASGQVKVFQSLDQMESEGTTVTIKVLVHLELLSRLLNENTARIPFFLDEVSVLDDQNLSAIIAHARAMNFVPVVASPDARDCVDTLYFLRSSEGRVVLEPETSRVRVKRRISEGELQGLDELQELEGGRRIL